MKHFLVLLCVLLCTFTYGQETKIHPVQIHQSGATANQVLSWNGTKWIPSSPTVGSDNQTISLNTSTNVVTLEDGGTIDLTPFKDNTDAQTIAYNDATGSLSIQNGNNIEIVIGKRFITDYITTAAGSTVTASASIPADYLQATVVTRNGLVQRIGNTSSDVSISGATVTFNIRALEAGEMISITRPK